MKEALALLQVLTVWCTGSGISIIFSVASGFWRIPSHFLAASWPTRCTSATIPVLFWWTRNKVARWRVFHFKFRWKYTHSLKCNLPESTQIQGASPCEHTKLLLHLGCWWPPFGKKSEWPTAAFIPKNPASSLPPFVWMISTNEQSDLSIRTALVVCSKRGPAGSKPVILEETISTCLPKFWKFLPVQCYSKFRFSIFRSVWTNMTTQRMTGAVKLTVWPPSAFQLIEKISNCPASNLRICCR